jgi:hypothetical protein
MRPCSTSTTATFVIAYMLDGVGVLSGAAAGLHAAISRVRIMTSIRLV